MHWSQPDLERFFEAVTFWSGQNEDIATYDYQSSRLNYRLMIVIEMHLAFISADPVCPFGSESLYEFTIPCDKISLIPDPYRPGEFGLAFWYGEPQDNRNETMQIWKREDGDLKVWPYPHGAYRT